MPLLEQVLETYPEQIKIVYKHFPIKSHKFAVRAARASMAAQDQDRFWAFHDRLFANYKDLNDRKLEDIASELKLDWNKMKQAMASPETMDRLRRDVGDAEKAGVRGTPSIFINGKVLKNRTLKGFQTAIDTALK